ncbi:MAG: carboxypeptidase-like regulatory domain-containing protein [Flavobacteriales bacterium]
MLDIQLDPLPNYTVEGVVRTAGSATPVEGAIVRLEGLEYGQTAISDADGVYRFTTVYEDDYMVTAGRWGWNTACPANIVVAGSDRLDQVIELEQGVADDFALDLGWQVSTTASRGAWVRGTPQGTMLNNTPSNPGADVLGDCRGQAYVTGNGGGQAGADDVDEGATVLSRTLFDATGMAIPHLRFHHWFFNGGGNSSQRCIGLQFE